VQRDFPKEEKKLPRSLKDIRSRYFTQGIEEQGIGRTSRGLGTLDEERGVREH